MGKDEGEAPGAQRAEAEVVVDRPVRCAACGAVVTSEAERISVLGAHRHRGVNPAGVEFTVVCFAHAPGVHVVSNPSREWSWFPGYAWQIESCRACQAHLGWWYARGGWEAPGPDRAPDSGAGFHGLIEDRLATTSPPG